MGENPFPGESQRTIPHTNKGRILQTTSKRSQEYKIMKDIRPIGEIAEKWAKVTPGRSAYYKEGTERSTSWEDNTSEAEDRYEGGISEAIGRKAFGKGVRKTGLSGWKEGVAKKGVSRWGPGVRVAEDKYREGFAPFASEIASIDLPPKYAKGDPRNIDRVTAIASALRKKKLELLG